MKTNASVLLIALLVVSGCSAEPTVASSITASKLGEVLYCLDTKLGPIGVAPPKNNQNAYLVQYYFGVLTPQEEQPNELQLIVYTSDGNSANYYRVYFDESQKNSIFIGVGGTLTKENGKMVPDEIPGGLGTLEEIQKVLDVTNKQKRLLIPQSQVVQGKDACIYEG